jgi:hypothetical protein
MTALVDSVRWKMKRIRENVKALHQANITPGQLPYLIREWRLWLQITRNFKAIEGSWTGAVKTYLDVFQGYPAKRERRRNLK